MPWHHEPAGWRSLRPGGTVSVTGRNPRALALMGADPVLDHDAMVNRLKGLRGAVDVAPGTVPHVPGELGAAALAPAAPSVTFRVGISPGALVADDYAQVDHVGGLVGVAFGAYSRSSHQ